MKAYLLSSIAAVLLLGTVSEASATIVTETYTGVVTAGTSFDLAGLFGAASPDRGALDNDPFKLVFTINTSNGTGAFSSNGGELKSGENYGTPEAITASIQINGITQQIFGTWFGTEIRNNNASAGLSSLQTSIEDTGFGSASADLEAFNTAIPSDLLTPFTFDPSAQGGVFVDASGSFNIGSNSSEAGGALTILNASVQVSSVPLPASLPMFGAAILGVGAIGFAMKRKNKVAAA